MAIVAHKAAIPITPNKISKASFQFPSIENPCIFNLQKISTPAPKTTKEHKAVYNIPYF